MDKKKYLKPLITHPNPALPGGLLSRADFETNLEELLLPAPQKNKKHVLFFIELNLFKIITDTYGHTAGDNILSQIHERLKAHMKPGDILARLNYDELALIKKNTRRDAAKKTASIISKSIRTCSKSLMIC
jgi:diguanylate cyclase (GGDEF)-like protein